MTLNIRKLNAADIGFSADLKQAIAWDTLANPEVIKSVSTILAEVKTDGDAAVLKWTKKLDQLDLSSAEELEIPQERLLESLASIPSEQLQALEKAAIRIITFSDFRANTSPLFKELKILKLNDHIILENCLFVYDSLKKKIPRCFKNYFTKLEDVNPNISTRNSKSGF